MNWRALILLIIALAAMAAATAAQMNEQWQVIEIKSKDQFSEGKMVVTYGLEEASMESEICYDDECEKDSDSTKLATVFKDCDEDENDVSNNICKDAEKATVNTLMGLNGIFGWGIFAIISSVFSLIGMTGNKFAAFFTLMVALTMIGVCGYYIMTFPSMEDLFGEDAKVTEYPGQGTWILAAGGLLSLIGAIIGFRGGEKDDGSPKLPEGSSSYYHGSMAD
jgi:amino acid transporter